MIHKIEDGDLLKFVPRIDADGKPRWVTEIDCIGATITKGSSVYPTVIYDLEGKWARRLTLEHSRRGGKSHYSKKYFANILNKNGEIMVVHFSRTLMRIITENPQLMDLRSNWHLNIKMEVRNSYPIFDKSHPVESNWSCPIDDLNSQEEWMSFLKNNQPDFETLMKERDISNKRSEMNQIFGDLMAEVISDDRNKKLDKLGL